MGDKNVLVPGNLEWDNGSGCFKEAPVKEHPIVNLELTVMADQLRSWHVKMTSREECQLPRNLRSQGLADTGTQVTPGEHGR